MGEWTIKCYNGTTYVCKRSGNIYEAIEEFLMYNKNSSIIDIKQITNKH